LLVIPAEELSADPSKIEKIVTAVKREKVICIQCGSTYRLAVPAFSAQAVSTLFQIKRRTKKAPALVFIPDAGALSSVAQEVPDVASALMKAFWPGPLTLLFKPSDDLPAELRKALTKGRKKIGVRVPENPVAHDILKMSGMPLLVSSANVASRKGAGSVAQVKQNFGRWLDVFVDAGDLKPYEPSTLVDFRKGSLHIIREGMIREEDIKKVISPSNEDPP